MKISELSQLTNVSTRSIRHYEEKGLLQAERLENDYRYFNESAVNRVKMIQLYLKLGLTADEIRTVFRGEVESPDDYEYCEEMLAIYEQKLSKVNEQIGALQEWKKTLERQISITRGKKATS
ncbi:MerR family transcriptional regulator [Brevibacillus formosus]|uniref:MerR family transcriptional regulator n=1 Tax=Brevibacillus formosus TaxID=54913 RepID=A0A837KS44_9BACL|nr:MerR family transcriptional regulator [Brevibacillus formosus]KLI00405.1 MerR family transcriptional regulator [Brevibacillus formosus]MED1958707.1 MerR family transcriptional regulator [Brevibacillus formosus]PSJ92402.1 MerR family DNA-binding transcriptional regulator [Brevibacillus formosus]GED57779.1 MerR family transcriptional regulator [Brevibacillus formosus]